MLGSKDCCPDEEMGWFVMDNVPRRVFQWGHQALMRRRTIGLEPCGRDFDGDLVGDVDQSAVSTRLVEEG